MSAVDPNTVPAVRFAAPADLPFIFSTWLKSYRRSPAVQGVPDKAYYAGEHALINRLILRPNTRVLVATPSDAPDIILGYAVLELPSAPQGATCVHYVYVKQAFRQMGIASQLLRDLPQGSAYSHYTKACQWLFKGDTFNPYLAHS